MDPNPPPQQPSTFADFETKTLVSASNSQTDDFSNRNDYANADDASGTAIRGSIAERRAAKCGFKAERINTARFRTTSPLNSPAATALVRSPCITIPPGISPTALLDSPIMLPNSQPSPTTGTFPLPLLNYESPMLNTVTSADGDEGCDSGSFRFKPHQDPGSLPEFSTLEIQANNVDFQAGSAEPSMDFEFPVEFSKEATTDSCAKDSETDVKVLNSMIASANFSDMQMGHADVGSKQISLHMEPVSGENIGTRQPLDHERGIFRSIGMARNSEDGYNWRKYGQKQVKGSEYPRSYYKCTHPNCQVKKKIERSHDGQITEIIYKGAHNHPKPQPSRRAQVGPASSFDEMPEMDEASENRVKVEVGSIWKNPQPGSRDFKADGLERTSSTSVLTELSDPFSTTQVKSIGTFESAETPELSSTLVSNDDDDDGATQGSLYVGVDADIEESESKRRKIDSCLVETSLASRAVREPRVVVQIESDVDILDDGYRWRKYGQKVVKGNPNPRSYYKCTSAGCSVRKHVERASHNLKYVITTYEGKHNHEVPAARNSNNVNSNGSNLPQVTTNTQPALALTRNANGAKPETQFHELAPGFDRKPIFNNEFLRPSFPGNFSNEMKLGASTIYPLKFPTFQHTMPYNSFDFNRSAIHHSGSIASLVPNFPISLPSTVHASATVSLSGVDFNYNGKPIGQGQPFLSGQQLVKPKQEQRDDNLYEGQPIIDHVNASQPSSVYQHIMGNFPS
ncbi:WRKY transcription factor SUSIBA2 isoform X1 [Jatropha curcas]|uniref:WRKY transcription factor SUSIBA2 isoform X1 n=1 Tax=Jatropha curcas TaxID=180498 RepID=UPI0005FB9E8C|nr:WRKY transcription factor SUSIBA2 isoform X1 [Jatropha curcas]